MPIDSKDDGKTKFSKPEMQANDFAPIDSIDEFGSNVTDFNLLQCSKELSQITLIWEGIWTISTSQTKWSYTWSSFELLFIRNLLSKSENNSFLGEISILVKQRTLGWNQADRNRNKRRFLPGGSSLKKWSSRHTHEDPQHC